MSIEETSWEKEFAEKFVENLRTGDTYWQSMKPNVVADVYAFVRATLSRVREETRAEIREKLKGMRKAMCRCMCPENQYPSGYNSAIRDILESLGEGK